MKKKNNRTVWKFDSLKDMMDRVANEHGEKIAFKYKDGKEIKEVTYSQFKHQTNCLGTALSDLGFAHKHVCIIAENCYKYLVLYLTMMQSNGVYVPVDKELPANDALYVINNSDSEVLFYSKKYDKFIRENMDKFENVKYFIALDSDEEEGNILSYNKLMEKGEKLLAEGNTAYTDIVPNLDEMRMLIYTSGTTGTAKGVMLSESNLVNVVYYGLHVAHIETVALSVLPYNHSYEAVVGILVGIHEHATMCINENLKAVLKNLQLYKPDYVYLVPAFADLFYKKIWQNAEKTGKAKMLKVLIKVSNGLLKCGIDLRRKFFKTILDNFGGNLCLIVCGGAPIRSEVGAFFTAIGIDLLNGYGISECSPLISVNCVEDNDCRTVGHTLPCLEAKIDNPDENGDGEICVKSPTVMMGYYKMPEQTAEVLTEDGWFYTGDYGRFNENGLLMITGRKKNLIILSNGKNIFPEELEEYITAIPYVQDAVVYGGKNEDGLEDHLVAQVYFSEEGIKESGIENPAERIKADIDEAMKELPAYKRIEKVIVRDHEFVKTTTQKIKRNCLDQ